MRLLTEKACKAFSPTTALVRVDFNIKNERDRFRIHAAVPTIRILLKSGHRVVLLSHRENGRLDKKIPTLKSLIPALKRELGEKIIFVSETRSVQKIKTALGTRKERVVLLENLRFWKQEKENGEEFAKQLSSLGSFFVNEAFSVSHRNHASIVGIPRFLPAFAGLQLQKEIGNLDAVRKARRPLVVVIGGVKGGDKAAVIQQFLKKADAILLGGGVANTFFAALGFPVGNSAFDKKVASVLPKEWLTSKIIALPHDVAINERQVFDIGPRTIEEYQTRLKKAETIVWSGPMGHFEKSQYAHGTRGIWQALVRNKKAKIVVGGGETLASRLLLKNGAMPKHIFLSTGGGAMLHYLSEKILPGIEALKSNI